MDGQKADIVVTDPPYNVGYTGGTKDALTIQNDKQEDSAFRQFLSAVINMDAAMKPGAVFYIWHIPRKATTSAPPARRRAGRFASA